MKIIVDVRERYSGIVRDLGRHGFDVEVRQLEVADFIVKTKSRSGVVETVGIEKKTQSDFLSSIADKRLIKQLMSLKENFSLPLLIIEGDENMYTLRNFHPNAIRGMFVSIAVDLQVPILHTRNVRDTAAVIATIAKRMEKPHSEISLNVKRRSVSLADQQEAVLESIPGVGRKLAKNLLEHFGSVEKVFRASVKELQNVEKIGKKKAQLMKEILERDYRDGVEVVVALDVEDKN